MADLPRLDAAVLPRAPSPEIHAKIEELLLAGLDYYFAAQYEQAIGVWTRVLFLDRNHARARAYIERARGAVAEQQRESEELLQQGVAAFGRGAVQEARELLTSAIERGGAHDVAMAVLGRLDRLEAPGPAAAPEAGEPPAPVRSERQQEAGSDRGARRRLWLPSVVVTVLIAAGVYAAATWDVSGLLALFVEPAAQDVLGTPAGVQAPLPVVRSAELALSRARALAAGGHLRDALLLLQQIGRGDPERPAADRLKAEIQRTLLIDAASRQGTRAGTGPS